jgi:hypothetical protein
MKGLIGFTAVTRILFPQVPRTTLRKEATVANRDMDVLSFRMNLEPVRTVVAA